MRAREDRSTWWPSRGDRHATLVGATRAKPERADPTAPRDDDGRGKKPAEVNEDDVAEDIVL